MRKVDEKKYICDLCKKEFDDYPAPQTVVVNGKFIGANVVPDMCEECQNKVSDFIDTLRV